ncbi:MAG: glutamate-cysteine ligase family protein, partial [Gammaproteobacteria bacterium]|nr:glutamate-cysteine ligase family protein [Gammaproteobacteria bacterium]
MTGKEPTFTLGIEEEYLLVDRETRGLVIDPPQTLMAEAEEKCGSQVTSEFLQSQIEIGTKVCANIKEAHEDLARLRRNVIDVADRHGLAPIAASTHPFS